MSATPAPEFSHVVPVARIDSGGRAVHLSAGAAERRALAERYRILEVRALEADAELRRLDGGRIGLHVRFDADVLQSCSVTLEPVASRITSSFDVVFDPHADELDGQGDGEIVLDAESDEDVEPLVGGQVDVGEMIAQYLSLELDPYPRDGAAALPLIEPDDEPAPELSRPFQVLSRIRGGGH